MKIKSYAAFQEKSSLEPFEYEAQPLDPESIEVRITHCGVCHSDIHLIDNDWQISSYPLVPGHEIIGTITKIGTAVHHLQEGQRVGIGWQRGACLECSSCLSGDDNLCKDSKATCVDHYGGFAEAIRVDGRFAFSVPETLSSENAAPLLCGGITVFSPLRHFDVRPTMKVGVIGIGGLGHLALQFTRAWGCEVTAFSSSADKEEEARKFGAHHFISSTDSGSLERAANSLDFLLCTVPVDLNWEIYLNVLRSKGTLCFVGAVANPVSFPVFPLIVGRKSVVGSPIGGRATIGEMLEFAALHNICAKTEILPMSSANEAIDKVRNNTARYRMVLAN